MVLLNIENTWAQPQEATFNFTGGQQSFVVPPGVTSIHIEAWGAQGADATFPNGPTGIAGLGGFAEGDLAVTPGQILEIFVGGQGTAVTNAIGGGGFNGGGDAQELGTVNQRGGGGGASDVRVGGTTFNDRVIVAGGGGGACAATTIFGGDGGGLVGGDGVPQPGGGGTQIAGGIGFGSPSCLVGELGLGGDAGTASCAGGGGGWYGGGSGCGAGGGSSYIDGVDNGNTTSGGREGNGMVVLSWIIPAPTISLSPLTATNELFEDHTVIATVLNNSVPEEGVEVSFVVTDGPNEGIEEGNDTTDSNGEATFTYASSRHGTDTIVAQFIDPNQGRIDSNSVTKTWILTRNVPTLSEWGLLSMAALLGIIGFMVIRRRKVPA